MMDTEQRPGIPRQDDIPDDVRRAATALMGRVEAIRRILTARSCLPEQRRRAKDELKALSKDALKLWSLI